MHKFHVLIPAAGSGSRLGTGIPKQYLPLFGKPILQHTLERFASSHRIASITLVLSLQDAWWESSGIPLDAKTRVLHCGGETRAQTVLNGLLEVMPFVAEEDWILVHDAARPGLSQAALDRLLVSLEQDAVGGLLALPLADTLKRANADQRVMATEPRDGLWQAQTPQMFRYGMLKHAFETSGQMVTDEASAIEALGYEPKLIEGEWRNLKITYPQDLRLVEAILAADQQRSKP